MSYGFEIFGPSGDFWLSSSDLTTRFIGVWQLTGTGGTIYHSMIEPGKTLHNITVSHYLRGASTGGGTYADARTMPAHYDTVYMTKINTSYSVGALHWSCDTGPHDTSNNARGVAFIYLFRYR